METPRDVVLAAMRHEETEITPYGIGFHPEPSERLTRYFGDESWRDRVVAYIAAWGHKIAKTPLAPGSDFFRDEWGCVWQHGSIWHIHESPLKRPSLDGYAWPDFSAPERYEGLDAFCAEHPDQFRLATTGVSFFEYYWKLRGWEGLYDFAAEPRFANALLDRLLESQLQIVDRLGRADVDCIGIADDQSDQRGVTIGPPRWRAMLKPMSGLFW